jgi:hypothetical protein
VVRLNRTEGYSVRMSDEKVAALNYEHLSNMLIGLLFMGALMGLGLLIQRVRDDGFKEGLTEGLKRREEILEREIERLKERLYDAGLDDD